MVVRQRRLPFSITALTHQGAAPNACFHWEPIVCVQTNTVHSMHTTKIPHWREGEEEGVGGGGGREGEGWVWGCDKQTARECTLKCCYGNCRSISWSPRRKADLQLAAVGRAAAVTYTQVGTEAAATIQYFSSKFGCHSSRMGLYITTRSANCPKLLPFRFSLHTVSDQRPEEQRQPGSEANCIFSDQMTNY